MQFRRSVHDYRTGILRQQEACVGGGDAVVGERWVLCQFPEVICRRDIACQENRERSFAPCENIYYLGRMYGCEHESQYGDESLRENESERENQLDDGVGHIGHYATACKGTGCENG